MRSTASPTRPSRPLILFALCLLGAGAAFGVNLLGKPASTTSRPDANAWPAHIALGAVLLAIVTLRVHRGGWGALLTPLTVRAATRLRAGLVARSPRVVATVALTALIGYLTFRIGVQLTAGLDPAFTLNAWGGPTYLGALLCHAIDAVLIAIIAFVALHLTLPETA